MRIVLIRHGRVLVDWRPSYDSAGYDAESARYDRADIVPPPALDFGIPKVYVSSLPRTTATAASISGGATPEVCPLLDEVPIRSFRDTDKVLPTWVWNLGATLQWLRGHPRQREGRKGTIGRAEAFLDLIESRGEDCVVVGHGIMLSVLMKRMKRRGYTGRVKGYLRNAESLEFQGPAPGGKGRT